MASLQTFDKLPELEFTCPQCRGLGTQLGLDNKVQPCRRCSGVGYLMTPMGEQIADLVQHQFKRMLAIEKTSG